MSVTKELGNSTNRGKLTLFVGVKHLLQILLLLPDVLDLFAVLVGERDDGVLSLVGLLSHEAHVFLLKRESQSKRRHYDQNGQHASYALVRDLLGLLFEPVVVISP